MRKAAFFALVLALWLVSGILPAEPPGAGKDECPAEQASQKGLKLLEDLHQVMAPAWHNAYPNKDFVALGEAMAKFDVMIPKVKELAHTFKTVERQGRFDSARTRFIDLVAKGKAAFAAKDYETLYNLMPDLHNGFEEMAYYILPLEFPEFASLRIVVDLMIDTHLKNNDVKAIVTSLEALKIKNEELQKAALPEDLNSVADKARASIVAIGGMCKELEAACGSISTQAIIDTLTKLKKLCDTFEQDYI